MLDALAQPPLRFPFLLTLAVFAQEPVKQRGVRRLARIAYHIEHDHHSPEREYHADPDEARPPKVVEEGAGGGHRRQIEADVAEPSSNRWAPQETKPVPQVGGDKRHREEGQTGQEGIKPFGREAEEGQTGQEGIKPFGREDDRVEIIEAKTRTPGSLYYQTRPGPGPPTAIVRLFGIVRPE
jgi:hypothetical protein